jgi:hypothetical protein
MGKYLEKFHKSSENVEKVIKKAEEINEKKRVQQKGELWNEFEDYNDPILSPNKGKDIISDPFLNEFPLMQQAQKPESFHRYILENQYQDLERSIRGIKDIFDVNEQKWRSVKKKIHCFTDEEAENILRSAQSHLSSDIKLSIIPKETFGDYLIGLFMQFDFIFRSIAEYRYGRYGSTENQRKMKELNLKILIELWTRIQANYSRAIEGRENRYTHDNIKGQESLNNSGNPLNSMKYF